MTICSASGGIHFVRPYNVKSGLYKTKIDSTYSAKQTTNARHNIPQIQRLKIQKICTVLILSESNICLSVKLQHLLSNITTCRSANSFTNPFTQDCITFYTVQGFVSLLCHSHMERTKIFGDHFKHWAVFIIGIFSIRKEARLFIFVIIRNIGLILISLRSVFTNTLVNTRAISRITAVRTQKRNIQCVNRCFLIIN